MKSYIMWYKQREKLIKVILEPLIWWWEIELLFVRRIIVYQNYICYIWEYYDGCNSDIMEHIVKTYILLLFSLLVSSIGYAQEENDIIYIQEGKWGVILCGERGYAWLDNKGDTIFGFGKLQEISADDDFNLVLAEKAL